MLARITGRGDVLAAAEASVVVTGTEAAIGVVREWLVAFERAGGDA